MFDTDIFSPHSASAYRAAVGLTADALLEGLPQRPYRGGAPAELASTLPADICPPGGRPLAEALADLRAIVGGSVAVWHPHTAAHLHTPVVIPALAAEMVLSALNPSMDSFDQAPAATLVELKLLRWLCELVGLPPGADGTFTSGGTQSNYMALWLARDHYLATRRHWRARERGLPPDAGRLRILCSEVAHFSVERSAMQLGLGTQAVVKVSVDGAFRMRPDSLADAIRGLNQAGLEPFAIVATAGTTDFGSIDPLEQVCQLGSEAGLWVHIDAAYGGALLLTETHQHKLAGIARADSVTLDFHKAFFQPISCGAFLLADSARFGLIGFHADYLNPESRELAGIPDLVGRSVLTTRRFDALKLWFSLRVLGRHKFAEMVERLCELAERAAAEIEASADMELVSAPQFGSVVFRLVPKDPAQADRLNDAIPLRAFFDGVAIVGHTVVGGRACLKFTFNNPAVEPAQVPGLLDVVRTCGTRLQATS